MKLLKRFSYYLGGMGIGVIFVIFFLGGKDASCSYFPNARVLKEIRFKHHQYSAEVDQFMQENKLDSTVISKLLNQGDVDFKASQTDTHKPCRVYVINGKYKMQNLQIEVEECKAVDSVAVISKAKFVPKD